VAIINHRFLAQIGWQPKAEAAPQQPVPTGYGGGSYDSMGMDMMGGGYMPPQAAQQQPAAPVDPNSARARLQSLLGDRNVKLILQVPLIFVNVIFIFLELLLG
jgi:hypothetical protein